MLKKLLLAGAFCLSFVLIVQARTYYLPDYQATIHFGNRTNQGGTSASTPKPTPTCGTYGLYTAASRPSNADCTMVAIPGLVCYSCTTCSNSYIYNSSNCTGEYVPSGNSCGGKYDKCICDPAKYIATADGSGCEDGETADTSTSCVDKTTGKTLYTCIADPCYGLADNTSELGCDKYYDQCPSKCQLGSTCKPTDCSAYTLASCPSGSTCESCTPGCGDTAKRYKEFKGLAFQVNSPANGEITFTITGRNYQIDWGDGSKNSLSTHTYKTAGLYDIKILGGVKTFSINSGPTAKPIKLYSLDLPKVTKITLKNACSTLTGTVPPLPDSLTDGSYMFEGCFSLTGGYPKLPQGLKNGKSMFGLCSNFKGDFPSLPDGLEEGDGMFSQNFSRGPLPKLPSKLKNGSSMFAYNSPKGPIPELPEGLTDGSYMFAGCDTLTGNIPALPSNLKQGDRMFYYCSGLKGSIPKLPTTLRGGISMFESCTGLTGQTPVKPSGLSSYTDIFSNTKVTNDGSWLDDAW